MELKYSQNMFYSEIDDWEHDELEDLRERMMIDIPE
jgi:hypothetical protein